MWDLAGSLEVIKTLVPPCHFTDRKTEVSSRLWGKVSNRAEPGLDLELLDLSPGIPPPSVKLVLPCGWLSLRGRRVA